MRRFAAQMLPREQAGLAMAKRLLCATGKVAKVIVVPNSTVRYHQRLLRNDRNARRDAEYRPN